MRALLIALTCVLTVGLAGCESGDGSDAGPAGGSSPSRHATRAPDPAQTAAIAYVRALYSSSGQDASPGQWLGRVEPYVTKAWYGELRDERQESGGAGDDWPKVKRQNLRPHFERLDARPVVEAPNSADRHYVRVIYSLAYQGADDKKVPELGTGGPRPMILVLTRSGRRWLVAEDQTGKAG